MFGVASLLMVVLVWLCCCLFVLVVFWIQCWFVFVALIVFDWCFGFGNWCFGFLCFVLYFAVVLV